MLAVVWLVEPEEMSGRVLVHKGGSLDTPSPLAGVVGVVRVQHWNVLEPRFSVASGTRVPIV